MYVRTDMKLYAEQIAHEKKRLNGIRSRRINIQVMVINYHLHFIIYQIVSSWS